jgi:dual oxidase maturation factor 1
MAEFFKNALYRGTPFPIVSLAEYFSLHQEGFSWGVKYREAGYYASVMLWYDRLIISGIYIFSRIIIFFF